MYFFRELYSLAEKWFDLWNKMISLESRSNNVQRLNNRGGQLLKEEKERKTIQKVFISYFNFFKI